MQESQPISLEAQFQRGQEAEQFLRFINDNPYFKRVFIELEDEIDVAIRALDPLKRDEWSVLQAKRVALYEPMNRVHVDIALGQQAYEILNNVPKQGPAL